MRAIKVLRISVKCYIDFSITCTLMPYPNNSRIFSFWCLFLYFLTRWLSAIHLHSCQQYNKNVVSKHFRQMVISSIARRLSTISLDDCQQYRLTVVASIVRRLSSLTLILQNFIKELEKIKLRGYSIANLKLVS
jgi:hypothetical protein